jgi:hypothetical protein
MIKSNGFVFCISRQAPFSVLRYMRPIRFRKVQDEFDEQYRWRVACVKTGQHTKPTRTAKLASCLTRDSCYYRRVCECETGPFLTLKQKLAPVSNTEPCIGAAKRWTCFARSISPSMRLWTSGASTRRISACSKRLDQPQSRDDRCADLAMYSSHNSCAVFFTVGTKSPLRPFCCRSRVQHEQALQPPPEARPSGGCRPGLQHVDGRKGLFVL